MMYHLKKIINHDEEIVLPKCMYCIKNPNECLKSDEIDLKISEQVITFLKAPNKKMAELEQRQDQLLKKLDFLYDRIKTISSYCSNTPQNSTNKPANVPIPAPDEFVLAISPDNLPWYLNIFLKGSSLPINITCHIHSSVANEKVPKIKAFIKNLQLSTVNNSKVNLRLIFKSGLANSELRISTLAVPILGNVNILRYLSYLYPNILSYDDGDYILDGLLDLCHVLERTPEKNKEAVLKNFFSESKIWIHNNQFTIVDIAVFNVLKQWQNSAKYAPKNWFEKCEKLCL